MVVKKRQKIKFSYPSLLNYQKKSKQMVMSYFAKKNCFIKAYEALSDNYYVLILNEIANLHHL